MHCDSAPGAEDHAWDPVYMTDDQGIAADCHGAATYTIGNNAMMAANIADGATQ